MSDSSVPFSRLAAAAVHVYTAVGATLAFGMVAAAVDGDVRTAFALMLAAIFVDGSDGLLARRMQVTVQWPGFDGALLDNIVDYLTYVFAPMVLLWRTGFLPPGRAGLLVACLPLLASCFQFCRTDAKTDDHYFLGFPSYWNVVAFYAVVLHASVPQTTALLAVLSALAFVPIRYVYPSRASVLFRTNMAFTAGWFLLCAVVTAQLPEPSTLLVSLSLGYIAFYVAESWWLTARHRRAAITPVTGTAPARTAPVVPSAPSGH
jgi:phosphatidylcholine synthase